MAKTKTPKKPRPAPSAPPQELAFNPTPGALLAMSTTLVAIARDLPRVEALAIRLKGGGLPFAGEHAEALRYMEEEPPYLASDLKAIATALDAHRATLAPPPDPIAEARAAKVAQAPEPEPERLPGKGDAYEGDDEPEEIPPYDSSFDDMNQEVPDPD